MQIKELIDDITDVNDPAKINYWVAKGDYLVYLEGWADECLAGTGFPPMERGGTERKLSYMEDLTPNILREKAEEYKLKLVTGGFQELPDATFLYGATWGLYEIPYPRPKPDPAARLLGAGKTLKG